MSTSSYYSNVLATVGLGQPTNLEAFFEYKYYVKEEFASESTQDYRSSTEGTPRKVVVSFNTPEFLYPFHVGTPEEYSAFVDDIDKVHSVEDIPNMSNTYVTVQDTGLLSRANEAIERSCKIRGITGNQTDKSLALAFSVTGSIDPDTLQKLSVNYSSLNMTFYAENKTVESEKYTLATGFPVTALVYDKFVADVCAEAESSNPSRSPIALGLLAKYLYQRQTDERKSSPKISGDDFTTILAPTTYSYTADSGEIIRVGYLIERIEELSSGDRSKKIIGTLDPNLNSFTDYNIRYGSRYSYTIRAVYSIQVDATLSVTGDNGVCRVLVSSTPSNIASVTTEEKIPPQPPNDISFNYDHTKNVLAVRWEFPIDKTNDVTRFQLFRRSSLSQPFTLLKEFDFDQSVVKIKRNEAPLFVNVSTSTFPIKRAVDYDFGRASEYIYALCSVDAHGYVSNYSSQYKVTFSRMLNSIIVKCISQKGAPRPYPNLYVDTADSLTLDTITRSGISAMTVSFDPEYLTVKNSAESDLGLIKYESQSAKYYVNMIDTTRAEQISVPISIQDLRST